MSLLPGITVHCRVRNEENFVGTAIRSVLPLAERVLVFDTASTDRTLEVIESIGSPKIEIVRKPACGPIPLTKLRNEMVERTTTEWYMLVDGDEVYPERAVEALDRFMRRVGPNVHRIAINRRHFVRSFNFVSTMDRIGRIYRTEKIRQGSVSSGAVGHETPYLIDAPLTPWRTFSVRTPPEVFFFHCQYLPRSSKDQEMQRLRGWRKPPFPVFPYFGPWPAPLDVGDVERYATPATWALALSINGAHLKHRCLRPAWGMPVLWRMKTWPPKHLVTFDDRSNGARPRGSL